MVGGGERRLYCFDKKFVRKCLFVMKQSVNVFVMK